ncbi:hypothetical protein [Colwellia sp. E2M01]|uniref:hypothetical protein n=1 Tax=Colwellia sp. E2M01 TaxID=2841561 RepID=UPI001C0A28AC|nr:hypothetical protein [Colwellia sp. E2M01]MBU2869797.1 hypothetical protein [Colwellia sp. E2M01]
MLSNLLKIKSLKTNIFNTKPVVDEDSQAWIFDTFAWCITQLDGEFFKEDSQLILPNNSFYPGSASSVEEMANAIFTNTTKYTGMNTWPLRLVTTQNFIQKPMPKLTLSTRLRGENAVISIQDFTTDTAVSYSFQGESFEGKSFAGEKIVPTIDIAFHQSQLNQPQDLIAYLVQIQAKILVNQFTANTHNTTVMTPPGGKAALPQTIDLVACFMGFGVIFANTAYQFKGGCGSCNNRNLNRTAALPELETVYALALFCVIKGESLKVDKMKQVKKTLKPHLVKPFRQSVKEITLYLAQTTNTTHAKLASFAAKNN